MAFLMPVMMLVMNLTVVGVIWFGGIRIDNGGMQIGDLMAFIQYVMQIMFALVMASVMFVMIPRAAVSAKRINEVLEMTPTMTDEGTQTADREKGTLVFDRVTFRYPGAETPVLSDISFAARPGEVTAVIGGTGSGKSTLVNLIPRFYDVTEGSIRVNGVDSQDVRQEELRSKIGFVPQKALLFTGTIAGKHSFRERGRDRRRSRACGANRTSDRFHRTDAGRLRSTDRTRWIERLGGQKQRLSIARALVRRPDLYVFDDSFSALDFKTDAALRKALREETREATVLIVAQRVSTVIDADQIIVLDEGKVAGIGTHDELFADNAVYQEIVKSQLSEEEIA